ncbi:MAG: argininosuccinate lyase [Chloroflexota bacterium]|nr:argininosuccinate lyase [Chloroflexota bacterium]
MSSFPDPVYAQIILGPQFAESQKWLFEPMLESSEAHLLMLLAQDLMPADQAARVAAALGEMRRAGAGAFAYAPEIEDLFFQMEARVLESAGEEAGGNLHLARSRNDLDAAMARLTVRRLLLETDAALSKLRSTFLRLIGKHVRTLMAGHTHTQPAQPTTLAHYLASTAQALERDADRLHAAFGCTNRGPLGAAALTTSGFAIDRDLSARLLGFDDVVINSYDAIGGVDYALESLNVLTTCVLGLSRLIHDLLQWATREFSVLHIDAAFLQISSIMPQKKNPVVLEHLRARIGWVLGDAHTAATLVHSAALGDTVDVEDELYEPLFRTFEHGLGVLRLLDAALGTCTFDVDLLAQRASEGFTTATELADTLVRRAGLPFRQAHRVASRVVQLSEAQPGRVTTDLVDEAACQALGRPVHLKEGDLRAALDPWAFVEQRTIAGGPAPSAMQAHLEQMRARLDADDAWRQACLAQINDARAERQRRIAALST